MTESRPPETLSRVAVLRLLEGLDALEDGDAATRLLPPGPLPDDARARYAPGPAFATATGAVLFEGVAAEVAIAPPFPVTREETLTGYVTGPLRRLLDDRRTLAVVLLRLGGYSLGLYAGGRFVDAKTGGRFVKNRHRKGGQSQRRFERIREGQMRGQFDEVADLIRTRLLPHAAEIDWVVLGGDRHTVQAMLARAPLPPALAAKRHPRFLDTPEPRREVLERTPARIWASRVAVVCLPERGG